MAAAAAFSLTDTQTIALLAKIRPYICGTPGHWHYGLPSSSLFAASVSTAPALTDEEQQIVDRAIHLSNQAAQVTPSAASAIPVNVTQADTDVQSKVTNFLTDVVDVSKIVEDIVAIQKGGKAHVDGVILGWLAELDEAATQALIHLLTSGVPRLAGLLALFTTQVPVIAAIAGIIAIIGPIIGNSVTSTDQGYGLVIMGTLWLGIHYVAQ
ncbi:hypothetical protein [Edaphobacter modestus]|uniref:Uncharacterized protein n=1 Tax=Edaphobacter modestus TaxID=388466 RepID=A0A4Q7YSC9_9BACT|nr:hypothetical protein [Edaphobacter modestus]RZU40134.1 hypothetical protein BDD14_1566 [Edaphobacter modestus]